MSTPQEPSHVLEAAHYQETRNRLKVDPIVVQMAREVVEDWERDRSKFVHDSGSPRFELMTMANAEYRKRGGTDGGHIGAVAEVLVELLREGV